VTLAHVGGVPVEETIGALGPALLVMRGAASAALPGRLHNTTKASHCIVTLRVFGPDHTILAVVEADDIESVRTFALQSRLMQWNTVRINATYSLEEALTVADEVEPIF
jgi:hypothetical protein